MTIRKRLIIALVLLRLSLYSEAQGSAHYAYIPLVYQTPIHCGVEVWRGFAYQTQLADLHCIYTRYNPGTTTMPNLYRTWLLNGKDWSSLDFAAADIQHIKDAGSNPVVVFFGNNAGTCSRLPPWKYQEFANFVRGAVGRWDLRYIEIWNEPDYLGGHPNLYGCWGLEYTTQFVSLLHTVTNTVWGTSPNVRIGTSFALGARAGLGMAEPVASTYQDEPRFWLGFHYYEIYQQVPGWTLEEKTADMRALWNGSLWLTEANLRKWSQDGLCYDPDSSFQQAQAEMVDSALNTSDLDTIFIYGLFKYGSSWQCAALLQNDLSPNPAYEAIQNDFKYVP